jgi:hypothetical protein
MKLITIETEVEKKTLESILDNKGSPLSAGIVVNGIKQLMSANLKNPDRN